MENKTKDNTKKEISIPLFIPVLIIIIFITVFIYISNSKAMASTDHNIIETNSKNELEKDIIEIEEEILPSQINEIIEQVVEDEEISAPIENNSTQNTTSQTATYNINGENYTIVGVLNIPSLNIEYPILSETSTKLLKVSLNKYWGANPNEVGNMVVVGHNYKNNKFFSNLSKIQLGAIVKITDLDGKTLDYKVYDTEVIDPYDNSCTSQLTDGKTEITLITCHYENGSNHATKRFVVKARADI